jgi:alcohol dehydrogenase class IV
MKTLAEIIKEVKENKDPDYEDLRFSVLVLSSLLYFESKAISDLAEAKRQNKKPFIVTNPEWQEKESHKRRQMAFNKSPEDWIGWANNPENPEYQKRRKLSEKIYTKILNKI